MNINIDSLITFLIMWGTPTIMMLITYLKMNKDDKNDVKKDFKSAHFIFTIGFLVTGYFLASLGNLLTLNIMKLLGIPLMIIAGISVVADVRRKNKVKSILLPILILAMIFAVTVG
ncbi:hypothetical protein MKY34_08830 [Sporosarcina sp. FSL K6-1522]|uniref:hypothetical protein n=1 Tax=Sporosarcina sp. FSL K6-1522 TaxID=2921554 RepID=UPI003159A256